MSYTPNNDCVYAKAFSGCLAGLGGGGRYLNANAGDEAAYAQMADIYAQEFDTVWGLPAPTAIEEDLIYATSLAVWRDRSPLESKAAIIPGAYNGIVRGVIALVQEGNAQVVAEGIDPNGCTGTGPGKGPIPLFIDPSNVTGFASDNNTGQTANNVPAGSGPILTTAHLNSVLAFNRLQADTTITYMSDDPNGENLFYSLLDRNLFRLTFAGTPQVLHTGGTFNAGTIAINSAAAGGGQRQTVHTTDVVAWGPFIWAGFGGAASNPTYVRDTAAGPNLDTRAWIASAAGATASVTNPCQLASPFSLARGAFTIGDSYTVQRGSIINIDANTPPKGANTSPPNNVTFQDFAISAFSFGDASAFYNRCSFEGSQPTGAVFRDCYFGAGMAQPLTIVNSIITMIAGLFIGSGEDQFAGALIMGGDLYLTGAGLLVGPSNIANLSVENFAGVGAGVQCQDCTTAPLYFSGSMPLVINHGSVDNGLIWGSGNTAPLGIGPGATVTVSSSASTTPTVTNTSGVGDFEFFDINGAGVAAGRAWNEGADAYGPSHPTTWANLAAVFNFQCHNVSANSSIVGV